MTTSTLTNSRFAEAIGIHHTMASRLRNGERSPSIRTVIATQKAFDLSCSDLVDWLEAIDHGPDSSGEWLRKHVFSKITETEAVPDSGE